MSEKAPPFERFFDLDDLGQAGAEVVIALKGGDLARLAEWAEVEAVETFRAEIGLKRLSPTRFKLSTALEADIVQACVVTLEPVRSHIALDFSRELHVTGRVRHKAEQGGLLAVGAGEDEVPEEIESPHYDLAGPLLEEFSLAIDPYPRAAGVAFDSPADDKNASESPFAVLKALKERR